MKSLRLKWVWLIAGLICLTTGFIVACGPEFPNLLLLGGDQSLLKAPFTHFSREIKRMKLGQSRLKAVPPAKKQSHHDQTMRVELGDLRTALLRENRSDREIDAILERHAEQRNRIFLFLEKQPRLTPDPTKARISEAILPHPIAELPSEYAVYFQGSIDWHAGKVAKAREQWIALLNLPPKERPDKSTWAAYMLGKSFEEDSTGKAIHWFQETRELRAKGFKDSLGLAAASLGWEARIHLKRKNFVKALHLYLEQEATGDPSAHLSVRFTASQALDAGPQYLQALAKDTKCRQVVTTYLISAGDNQGPTHVDGPLWETMANALEKLKIPPLKGPTWHHYAQPADLWLDAMENARVINEVEAEKLGLAAYRAGQMTRARRWIALAPKTPTSRWIQAKLHLRQGNIAEAAKVLSDLTREFPIIQPTRQSNALPGMAGSLEMYGSFFYRYSMPEQARAELGVLQLARRNYAEALDALLHSGYWLDAAYVAEQVLTLEELKNYVDQHWPGPPSTNLPQADEIDPLNKQIRHLLARRLARQNLLDVAGPYYPVEHHVNWLKLKNALTTARTPHCGLEDRSHAFFEAALITRHQGMELMGTEGAPDFFVHHGNFEYGITPQNRVAMTTTNVVIASENEIQRTRSHATEPDKRFHYRYQAADLAWQAATLLPNDDEDTARFLCLAGTWLKIRDPLAADKYYKALVLRCKNTEWGRRADKIRWFPPVDSMGYLPSKPSPEPKG